MRTGILRRRISPRRGRGLLNEFDYQQPLPADAANLRNLLYSLITVSLAVELWKQPRVKHSANTILTRS
jgi:hypothetical protein